MALELKRIIKTNLIRESYYCINHYFHFNILFKQLYTSSKTECFSYKSGCSVHAHQLLILCLKEELA